MSNKFITSLWQRSLSLGLAAVVIAGTTYSDRYRWDYIQRSLSLGLHATIVIAGIAYSDRYRWRGTICNCICLQRSLLCSHHNCITTYDASSRKHLHSQANTIPCDTFVEWAVYFTCCCVHVSEHMHYASGLKQAPLPSKIQVYHGLYMLCISVSYACTLCYLTQQNRESNGQWSITEDCEQCAQALACMTASWHTRFGN